MRREINKLDNVVSTNIKYNKVNDIIRNELKLDSGNSIANNPVKFTPPIVPVSLSGGTKYRKNVY